MAAHILAYITLIALPIIVTQYPRYMESLHHHHPLLFSPSTSLAHHGADSKNAADDPSARLGGASDGTEEDRTTARKQAGKKPWDPPFPSSAEGAKRQPYRILRPTTELAMEDGGSASQEEGTKRSYDGVAVGGGKTQVHSPVIRPSVDATQLKSPSPLVFAVPEPLKNPSTNSAKGVAHPAGPHESRGFHPSLLQSILIILFLVVFMFAFAVLVAHCLAWFVVYKTESRLGEAKRGLLRGGDMRMCLCARG